MPKAERAFTSIGLPSERGKKESMCLLRAEERREGGRYANCFHWPGEEDPVKPEGKANGGSDLLF